MSIKIKRKDDWYILDLPREDYKVGTAVVIPKNQSVHVYQNGKYIGVCEHKGRRPLDKKFVKGIKKGLGAKTIKDVGLRFTHDDQAIVYTAKNKPLKKTDGKEIKINMVVKAVPFVDDMNVLDNFVVETNLRSDREGVLLYISSFQKAMANVIEQTLTECASDLKTSFGKWNCPKADKAKGKDKDVVALLQERLNEMFYRLGMNAKLTFSAR